MGGGTTMPALLVALLAVPAPAVVLQPDSDRNGWGGPEPAGAAPAPGAPSRMSLSGSEQTDEIFESDDEAPGLEGSTIWGITTAPCEDSTEKKTLDVLVYGATGFTGKHAIYHLASHPKRPAWGMSAKSSARLLSLAASLGDNNTGALVKAANTSDAEALQGMARQARVVLSYAGPYEHNGGERVLRAALASCAHYVDVTTETKWMSEMQRKYGPLGEARGLAIVQSAGVQALVPDFLAASAARDFARNFSKPPTDVKILYTKLNGGVQGGKVVTSHYAMLKNGFYVDPYLLVPDMPPHLRADVSLDGHGAMEEAYQPEMQTHAVTIAGAAHDAPVVRASMHMLYPKMRMTVKVAASVNVAEEMRIFMASHAQSRKMSFMPKPGQGPPVWVRMDGGFEAEATVYREPPNMSRVSLVGRGDPSNIGSSKLSVELALALASRGPKGGRGGYYTPATVFDIQELETVLAEIDKGKFLSITHRGF